MTRPPPAIALSEPRDFEVVGRKWRSLEQRADLSFFQTWTWLGCKVESRFPAPVLLQAGGDDAPTGLALLNRTGSFWQPERLLLGESGDATLDAIFTEYNAPLLARGHEADMPACIEALLLHPMAPRRRPARRTLRLSGVTDAVLHAARQTGVVHSVQSRSAPFVDLTALGDGEESFLASLSANTRYQLRRSLRRYEAAGPLHLQRADSVSQALLFLENLVRLHQATWQARGKPGAFADGAILAFHRTLIARAVPRREADLLRITAGHQVLGYLYNFVCRQRVFAYQSGFDYAAARLHQKPGLTSHYLAIESYRRQDYRSYDFLAGADRYKTSHSNSLAMLHWLDLVPRWSWQRLISGWR